MDSLQTDIVYAFATSPAFSHDGIVFAAQHSGLYRSEDGGKSWISAYESLGLTTPLPTLAVTISPDFQHDAAIFAGVSGGVLRSDDGGKTWMMAALSLPAPAITALAISSNFAEDGSVFAGSMEDGFFVSTDRGLHWRSWNFGLLDLNILCAAVDPDFKNNEIVFVGTENGLFRSTNGGKSWREINFPPESAPILSLAVHHGAIFAGTESSGLFVSGDGGLSWSQPAEDSVGDSVNGIALAKNSAENHVLVALSSRIIFSTDGGHSWQLKAEMPADQQITCFAAPKGIHEPALVGTADGTILRL